MCMTRQSQEASARPRGTYSRFLRELCGRPRRDHAPQYSGASGDHQTSPSRAADHLPGMAELAGGAPLRFTPCGFIWWENLRREHEFLSCTGTTPIIFPSPGRGRCEEWGLPRELIPSRGGTSGCCPAPPSGDWGSWGVGPLASWRTPKRAPNP